MLNKEYFENKLEKDSSRREFVRLKYEALDAHDKLIKQRITNNTSKDKFLKNNAPIGKKSINAINKINKDDFELIKDMKIKAQEDLKKLIQKSDGKCLELMIEQRKQQEINNEYYF